MYTKRSIVFRLCLISVAFSCGESVGAQSAIRNRLVNEPCVVSREEFEVFSAYLRYYHERAVIVTRTEVRNLDLDTLNLELSAQGRGIPPDLRADFKAKSSLACAFRPFSRSRNLRFISGAEAKRISRGGKATQRSFYDNFGEDSDLNQFSRVGFNSDKTLALIQVSGLGGGDLCLFERKNGKWLMKWHIEIEAT